MMKSPRFFMREWDVVYVSASTKSEVMSKVRKRFPSLKVQSASFVGEASIKKGKLVGKWEVTVFRRKK